MSRSSFGRPIILLRLKVTCTNFAIVFDIECATISSFARKTVKGKDRMPTLHPTPLRTLIFDLDGTLSDPMLGFSRSINHTLVSSGFQPCHGRELARYVGPDIEATFRALTGAPDSVVRILVDLYRERYEAVGFSENALYPGIATALDTFSGMGFRWGLHVQATADGEAHSSAARNT